MDEQDGQDEDEQPNRIARPNCGRLNLILSILCIHVQFICGYFDVAKEASGSRQI